MNGKFCLQCDICCSVRVMLRACDFLKFILKWARYWNNLKSLRRLGIVTRGLDRNRISSANAANLYFFSAIVSPWISELSRSLRRKGSSVRTNRMGERGSPDVCYF